MGNQRSDLTWKNPDEVKRYAERRYRGIDQRFLSLREQTIVRALLRELKGKDLRILDVPCGYGRFFSILTAISPHLVAGDLNIYALNYAKTVHKEVKQWVGCNVRALPFEANSFDIVFNFRLLQHFDCMESVMDALKEFHRITRKYVLFSIYIETPLHSLFRKIKKAPPRINMFRREELRERIKGVGYRLKAEEEVLPLFHAHTIYLLEKR